GTYQIIVRGQVFGKFSSSQLTFVVSPRYYQTTWFLVLLIVLILAFLYLFYLTIASLVKRNIERKSKYLHYQSTSLKGQINSHLLFNIFEAVASNIKSGHQNQAYDRLISLAEYIRSLLNQPDSYEHMLEEELSFCQQYMDFMIQIYPGKFEYRIESHSEYELEIATIPSVIVQPFLENAIIHGFRYPREEPYLLQINYYHKMGYLVIQVDDNGAGIDTHKSAPKRESKGIGLIKKKIRSYYSDFKQKKRGGIKIHSKNNPLNNKTGVLVSIFLPLEIKE
ncbi:MAG: histidine kinase, partial [Bacteroidetes bacterium]|nr:histidine kinase [Bacteroidota bacterium]